MEGPYSESTIYSIYGSQDAAVLALKKGDIDFMLNPLGLSKGLQEQLQGEAGLTTIENASDGVRYLGFNFRKEPMDNKAFRQAVATLIDKEFLVDTVLQGVAIPIYTMVPEGNGAWYNPDVPLIGKGLTRQERIAEAVNLLKEAGFTWETEPRVSEDGNFVEQQGEGLKMPNGEPVPAMEVLAPSPGYDPLRSTFAIWIERWLTEVGIPLRANLTGFNVIVDRVFNQQDFDMWILGWGLSAFPDYLEAFFHSRHSGLEGIMRAGTTTRSSTSWLTNCWRKPIWNQHVSRSSKCRHSSLKICPTWCCSILLSWKPTGAKGSSFPTPKPGAVSRALPGCPVWLTTSNPLSWIWHSD